ncbi:hypothetical protein TRFO_15212 [Tritrichomonas foetus]|uniref:Glucosidase 2 subunit beta n=1 Tax=Tritrichomonas foetus TaxID=1144522 RepID=A0A1J4KXZ0_9EUKA|nr:hypothetical protein TRFO_15212 [Tritrichomonas foetus]|eukprot:OHT14429.1 hypothetical protein TRFO_15212 [Tritrichomonas foetus]
MLIVQKDDAIIFHITFQEQIHSKMIVLFILSIITDPPVGAHPSTWEKYKANIDVDHQTFRCFDGSKIIPLNHLNNDYVDCPDGSDEPGTSAYPNGTFYCHNDGVDPMEIPKWSVGDGICDCCDGSDEFSRLSHSKCSNTCHVFIKEKESLKKLIKSKYLEGAKNKNQMQEKGISLLKKIDETTKFYKRPINFLNKMVNFFSNFTKTQTKVSSSTENPTVWKEKITKIWKFTFHPKTDGEEFISTFSNSFVIDLNSLIRKLNKKVGKTAKMVNVTDLVPPELLSLYGQKFENGEYTLKFLKKVKQPHNIVGFFKNMSGSTLYFDGGDHCWKTEAPRNFELSLVCGSENRLVSAEEPSVCVYKGIFETPFACSTDDVENVEKMNLNELRLTAKMLKIEY